jgi:hypothetical protein
VEKTSEYEMEEKKVPAIQFGRIADLQRSEKETESKIMPSLQDNSKYKIIGLIATFLVFASGIVAIVFLFNNDFAQAHGSYVSDYYNLWPGDADIESIPGLTTLVIAFSVYSISAIVLFLISLNVIKTKRVKLVFRLGFSFAIISFLLVGVNVGLAHIDLTGIGDWWPEETFYATLICSTISIALLITYRFINKKFEIQSI